MLTFNCYTWNRYLPEQGLIDGTCSFHSIRNTDYMMKILKDIKIYNNSYTKLIKKNNTFHKMKSYEQLQKDLDYLIDDKKKIRLNGTGIKQVMKIKNLSKNVFPVYYSKCKTEFYSNDLNQIQNIIKNKSYTIGFILFKKRLYSITHWCPVIIDKRDNTVNIHIADSYNMTWWGDPRINSLINYLYPGKKNIKCVRDNIKGDLYYISKTIYNSSVYFVALYLFIYALLLKLNIIL